MQCKSCNSYGHKSARSQLLCIFSSLKIQDAANVDAKALYGPGSRIELYTRKNYLNSALRQAVPFDVREKVKGYFKACVEKSRVVTFLASLLIGFFKMRQLENGLDPCRASLEALYNELCLSFNPVFF